MQGFKIMSSSFATIETSGGMEAKMRILSNLEPSGSRVVTVDSVMSKVVDCGVKAVPVNPISVVQGRFSRRDVAQVAEVVKTYE